MSQKAPFTSPPGTSRFDLDALVQDLAPVRRLQMRDGLAIGLSMMVLCGLAIAFGLGMRHDLANGAPHWMFVARAAILLGLGIAAAAAALASVMPAVGDQRRAFWKWTLAMAAVFPIGAAVLWMTDVHSVDQAMRVLSSPYGRQCLQMSALCGFAVGTAMTLWMKRGAPVNLNRAGWLVGLASGSLGAAAYSISCSQNSVMYIGTWYTLAIAGCVVAGRLIVPPILRW